MTERYGSGCSDASMAWVARQPIIDRAGRLVAYELLFRGACGQVADVRDGFRCTAEVVERTVGAMGLERVLGGVNGYLNCTADFLYSSVPDVLAVRRFVLEVLETCELNDRLKERCKALRARGFRIALDDVSEISPDIEAFLPVVDIVKLEWPAIEQAAAYATVRDLKRAGKLVIAEKVDNRDQWQRALAAGCDLVQGFYFSKPQLIEGRRMTSDVAKILEVLNLLNEDASIQRIVRALKAMPVLVVQLLRLANCPGTSQCKRFGISSLEHALAVAGTARLFQWCSLLLYNNGESSDADSDPLIAFATQRAFCMSTLAQMEQPSAAAFSNTAYLTGMLSLLHVVYGREQAEFAEELSLDPAIRDALLGRRGELGRLLGVVEAVQSSPQRRDTQVKHRFSIN